MRGVWRRAFARWGPPRSILQPTKRTVQVNVGRVNEFEVHQVPSMCASEDGERGGTPLVQGPMRARQRGAVIRVSSLALPTSLLQYSSPILDELGVRRARPDWQTAAPYARSRADVHTLGEDVGRVGLGLRRRAPARWGRGRGGGGVQDAARDSRRRWLLATETTVRRGMTAIAGAAHK